MIILPSGEFTTEDEDENDEMPSLDEEEEALPVKATDHAQRENIFYTPVAISKAKYVS